MPALLYLHVFSASRDKQSCPTVVAKGNASTGRQEAESMLDPAPVSCACCE